MYGPLFIMLIGPFSPNIFSGHFGPKIGFRTFVPLLEALGEIMVCNWYQLKKIITHQFSAFQHILIIIIIQSKASLSLKLLIDSSFIHYVISDLLLCLTRRREGVWKGPVLY